MRLLLVRHGQTTAPAGSYLGGAGDGPGLDATGRAQAAAVAAALARRSPVAAVVSPQRRARETAALALAAGTPLTLDPRLREIDFGVIDGLTWAEVEARHPAVAEGWRRELWPRPPGGEQPEAVAARVLACLLDVAGRHPDGEVVLVSHGGPLRIALGVARGLSVPACWRVRVVHGSLRSLRVTAAAVARWRRAAESVEALA